MKMGSALFWGLLLIIIGLSLVFRIVFNIDFPLFKIIIAFALIFLGIKMLFGSFGGSFGGFDRMHASSNENDVMFGEKRYSDFHGNRDFNIVFGKGEFDFRNLELDGKVKRVNISTVFGGSEIKLNKEMPLRIRVDAAFAGADLPNGNSAVFGSSNYESPSFDPDKPYLDIKLDVVFGGAEVRLY